MRAAIAERSTSVGCGGEEIMFMLRRAAGLARRNPPALPRPARCSSLASTPPTASSPPPLPLPPRVLYHFQYVRHLRQLAQEAHRLRREAAPDLADEHEHTEPPGLDVNMRPSRPSGGAKSSNVPAGRAINCLHDMP